MVAAGMLRGYKAPQRATSATAAIRRVGTWDARRCTPVHRPTFTLINIGELGGDDARLRLKRDNLDEAAPSRLARALALSHPRSVAPETAVEIRRG
jgi:acyl-CoA synthetase (NDP forming)